MKLAAPKKRALPDALLPLIDVVLFLIVFFMIASEFAAPEPFAVTTPEAAAAEQARGEFTLFLSADGTPGFVPAGADAVTGDATLPALHAARAAHCAATACAATPPVLLVKADLSAPADGLARLLAQATAAGFSDIRLLTVGR